MAALSLPLQDFHLLAFASFAGRTHQYDRLDVAREVGLNVNYDPRIGGIVY